MIGYDEPLSKPLNFSMERGQKIALVGTNGIGKTTLLKSILGLIPSISGECELGEKLQLGYFEQEVSPDNRNSCIEEIWEEFPSFSQYEVRSALAKCGLTTKHIESQVRVLSGGEQAKVRLCKLINRDTNILLLDEPTNYLDEQHIEWLKRYLQDYENAFILISHDIPFLNSVINLIYHMENCRLDRYPGDYDKFQEVYAMKKAQLEAAYNRQQQEISAPERTESISPLEHLAAFYQLQNNQPLTAEQTAFCQELIEEIWKEGDTV